MVTKKFKMTLSSFGSDFDCCFACRSLTAIVVSATDHVGRTVTGSSTGVTIDTSPPDVGETLIDVGGAYQTSPQSQLSASWWNVFTDIESGESKRAPISHHRAVAHSYTRESHVPHYMSSFCIISSMFMVYLLISLLGVSVVIMHE